LFDGNNGVPPRVAVVNLDDPYGCEIAESARIAGAEILGYGMDVGAFRASDVEMSASGMRFTMTTPRGNAQIVTRLTGRVNVYNLLAACAAAMARGLKLEEIVAGAGVPECVPGRFQAVDAGQPFAVVVDYAHTDDALKNLIALAREFVSRDKGRVITLFGCGGDRDRTKRPVMGRVAGEGSDLVVVTSDNPRSEEPKVIIEEAIAGLVPTGTAWVSEPDRAKAIGIAIQTAKPGDIVLIAGKGHEKVQVLRDRTIPFDDVEIARWVLGHRGYSVAPEPAEVGR
jgi:UDP-N-acetylmuramoyl-L-alanyl-D-glutamate--2,6-diaminopimelate ligase